MPLSTTDSCEVKHLRIIDEHGTADASLMPPLTDERIRAFFEAMTLARTYNSRALSLQREGRIGTYASILGQEASQVGSAMAFGKDDWLFPSFRESGVYVARGFPIWRLYRYWMGDERGTVSPEGMNIFPMCVPVGSQIPHITGAAMAMSYKGEKTVAGGYFGDGASSRGDFHESLNMAGVFKAPAVFLCQNNQWAISLPRARQSAAATLAQRAFSYGFEGIQVDGNDVVAVYKATLDAIDKARSGGGPTLIECVTYRLDDHTTADDASRYRDEHEVEEWQAKEPLIRLKLFMEEKGLWSAEYEEGVKKQAGEKIDSAITEAEALPAPEPADMLRHTYAELSERQRAELKEFGWQD